MTRLDPVALVRAGATRAAAARACGLSRQRVGQLCDAAGLPRGRAGRPSADELSPRSAAAVALVELAVSLGLDPAEARHALALGAALGGRAALRGALIDHGQAPGPIPDAADLDLARAAVVGVDYRDGRPVEWHLDLGGHAARPAWRVVLVPAGLPAAPPRKTKRKDRAPPLDSLARAMALSVRDWSENATDAWLYGVVLGWGDALPEVASRHGWSSADARRLEDLHLAVAKVRFGAEP